MKYVSVFMDVEDPINPLADDAALDLALLFSEAGVTGSFCLTGEKCRTLAARGRTDVIDAYRPHCLGLHTDTHSFHPTTMELLADLSFEEGCTAAFEAERKGYEAFCQAFDRTPRFWGGAGNTWSPEITDALKRLGIPAYAYALTQFPNEAVHRFNGVFALPQALSISELDWADDGRAETCSDFALQAIHEIPQPWVGIFVGHPTKLRHAQYWDTPFFGGRTPPAPELTEPHQVEVYERAKGNLRTFLGRLQEEVEVIGVDEMLDLPWKFRMPSQEEFEFFKDRTSVAIHGAARWPVHYEGLDASLIVEKTLTSAHSAEIAELT